MTRHEAAWYTKARSLFTFSSKTKPEKWGGSWFYPVDLIDSMGDDYLKYFQLIPELNSIINIRARARTSWDLKIVSKQTGKEVAANESLVRILRQPNWFQSQGELFRQSSIFHDLYGNEYLYFLTPIGMPNTYKGLYTLNPDNVEIEYNNNGRYFNDQTGEDVRYFYTANGKRTELDKERLIHLNDNRVEKDNILKGTSKIKALKAPLNNIIAAYRKRGIALAMPVGIIGNNATDAVGQALPADPEEKEKAERALRLKGGLPIMTNLAVNYSAMNVNAQQLGLFEETREDTMRICDVFGVPYELLASSQGVTYANLKEAKKQFYEETILPESWELIDALNQQLNTNTKSWEVVADYSHLPVFADDQRQRAISLNQMSKSLIELRNAGLITDEQAKAELEKFGI